MKKHIVVFILSLASAGLAQIDSDSLCTLTGTVYNQNGNPIANSRFVVSKVSKNGVLVVYGPQTYLTDATGVVTIILPRRATACIEGNIAGYSQPGGGCITVPDDTIGTLEALQPVTVTSTTGLTIENNDASPKVNIVTIDFSSLFTVTESPTREANVTLATGGVTNTYINASAAIARTKLASGTAYRILQNTSAGVMSEASALTDGQLLIGATGVAPVAATITGTSNQVVVTPDSGSITLSLPQSINTSSSPTFVNLTLSALTQRSFLFSGPSGLLTSTAAPTNGQLLIGNTGDNPTVAALTQGSGISISNGAGSITIAASSQALIGDTVEVDIFASLDTTSTNGSGFERTRLDIRRTIEYWPFDDTNSDTLIFSLALPDFVDSLEYFVPIFRANTNSGNYIVTFLWEFLANDVAFDNTLTLTNSSSTTISAPSASGDIRYARKTLAAGSSKSIGGARWMDGMIIRVGGDGSDSATGNMDLTGLMLGFSRTR